MTTVAIKEPPLPESGHPRQSTINVSNPKVPDSVQSRPWSSPSVPAANTALPSFTASSCLTAATRPATLTSRTRIIGQHWRLSRRQPFRLRTRHRDSRWQCRQVLRILEVSVANFNEGGLVAALRQELAVKLAAMPVFGAGRGRETFMAVIAESGCYLRVGNVLSSMDSRGCA